MYFNFLIFNFAIKLFFLNFKLSYIINLIKFLNYLITFYFIFNFKYYCIYFKIAEQLNFNKFIIKHFLNI